MLFRKLFGKKPAADQVRSSVLNEIDGQIASFSHVSWDRAGWLRALVTAREEIERLTKEVDSAKAGFGKGLAGSLGGADREQVQDNTGNGLLASEDVGPAVKKRASGRGRVVAKSGGDRRASGRSASRLDGSGKSKPTRRIVQKSKKVDRTRDQDR
jgi:hypothetical protein